MKKGAVISSCGKYRYKLWRVWDHSKPLVLFVMHNPSKADADIDDPTITRCINFAKSWGYGGFYVGNLSAYRATDPKELKVLKASHLYTSENVDAIYEMEAVTECTVLAYGVTKLNPLVVGFKHPERLHYITLSKHGFPCHPLYLKKNLTPVKFEA